MKRKRVEAWAVVVDGEVKFVACRKDVAASFVHGDASGAFRLVPANPAMERLAKAATEWAQTMDPAPMLRAVEAYRLAKKKERKQ